MPYMNAQRVVVDAPARTLIRKSMRYLNILFFLLILLTSNAAVFAAPTARIRVRPALVMREKPDIQAKAMGTIPFDTEVEITHASGPQATLLGVTGNWTQVIFAGKQGWVFGAFLGDSASSAIFDIVNGTAVKRPYGKCTAMRTADFPRFFGGGCIGDGCIQGCGRTELKPNGEVTSQGGCDGAAGSGRWRRKGKEIIIEFSVISMSPRDFCSYRDGTPACVRQFEIENQKECGKKNGCARREKRVLALPSDNAFMLDGAPTCVYP